jgi:hypothetical protein
MDGYLPPDGAPHTASRKHRTLHDGKHAVLRDSRGKSRKVLGPENEPPPNVITRRGLHSLLRSPEPHTCCHCTQPGSKCS